MNYKQAAEQLRVYSQIFYEERKRRGCLTYIEQVNELFKELYDLERPQEQITIDGLFNKLSQKVDN